MPCVSDIFFLSWFINNSIQANVLLLWSDATCRSVTWWIFSLCKFSLVDFWLLHNNVIQRKFIALNNKDTRVAHFSQLCTQKNCICASDYPASEHMKFVCAVNIYTSSAVCAFQSQSEWLTLTATLNPHLEVVKLRSNYEAMWVWVLIALHWHHLATNGWQHT